MDTEACFLPWRDAGKMSAETLSFHSLMTLPRSFSLEYGNKPLRDRSLIVASVVLAHALLLWFLVAMPSLPTSKHQEMSVSIATMPSPPQPAAAEPKPEPVVKPKPAERRVQPSPEVVSPIVPTETPVPTEVSSAPPQPVTAPPGLPDREPDYQAA